MTLPQWYWERTQFQKFCVGFGIFFAIGMLWHIRLLFSPQDWAWAKHDLTFLVAHPFFFAPAFGLVFSVLDKEVLGHRTCCARVLCGLFIGMAIAIVWIDHSKDPTNKLSPLVGAFETGVFMTAIAAFILYSFATIWMLKVTDTVFAHLSSAASLLVLWIPLRVYADSSQGMATGPQAKFAMLVAIQICICFSILAVIAFVKRYRLTNSVIASSAALQRFE